MKQYKYPEAKQIIVSGDIHGDFKTLVFKLFISILVYFPTRNPARYNNRSFITSALVLPAISM